MVLFETPSAEDLLAPSYVALLKQVSDSDRQRRAWYSQTVRATCRLVTACWGVYSTAMAGRWTDSDRSMSPAPGRSPAVPAIRLNGNR
jgi:hypothetical protein